MAVDIGTLWMEGLLALFLFAGGGGDLSTFLDTDTYWKEQGIPVTAASLSSEVLSAPVPGEEVQGWVRDLGAETYDVREAATRNLKAAGEAARPLLEEVRNSKDPEIRKRARKVLSAMPVREPGQDHERARMAVLALSRMDTPGAGEALRQISESDGPLSLLAGALASEKKPSSAAIALQTFPASSVVLGQWHAGVQPEAWIQEIRDSAGLQHLLRSAWTRAGHFRIDRITVSADSGMLQASPSGTALVWMEGRLEPGKLKALLEEAGLEAKEKGHLWKGKSFSVGFPPGDTQVLLVVHPTGFDEETLRAVTRTVLQETPTDISAELLSMVKPAGEGFVSAGALLPETLPDIPGLPATPRRVEVQGRLEDQGLRFEARIHFAAAKEADACQALLEEELTRSRELLAGEHQQEARLMQDLLSGLEGSVQEQTMRLRFQVSGEVRIRLLRQAEQWMGMFSNQRNPGRGPVRRFR